MDFWVLIFCFHIQYYRNIHEHVPGTHVLVSLGWSFSMRVPQLRSVYVVVQQGMRIPSALGGLWEVSSLAWGTD